MKCRDHYIRRQALTLLGLLSHTETVWRAEIAVRVAEEVTRIEEADFYQNSHNLPNDDEDDDDMGPFTLPVPTGGDARLPPLPDTHRMRRVLVSLPNGDADNCVIECHLAASVGAGGASRLTREYDPKAQRWVGTSKRSGGPIAGYNLFILRTPIGETRQ